MNLKENLLYALSIADDDRIKQYFGTGGAFYISLQLDSSDPDIVRMIEEEAVKRGISIKKHK